MLLILNLVLNRALNILPIAIASIVVHMFTILKAVFPNEIDWLILSFGCLQNISTSVFHRHLIVNNENRYHPLFDSYQLSVVRSVKAVLPAWLLNTYTFLFRKGFIKQRIWRCCLQDSNCKPNIPRLEKKIPYKSSVVLIYNS